MKYNFDTPAIALSAAICIIAFFYAISLDKQAEHKADIEKVKAGLEQCPDPRSNHGILWTTNCAAYMEAQDQLEEGK